MKLWFSPRLRRAIFKRRAPNKAADLLTVVSATQKQLCTPEELAIACLGLSTVGTRIKKEKGIKACHYKK